MPFDCLPESFVSDLVKLKIALDGVKGGWRSGSLGRPDEADHCLLGWLLVATDWDTAEATRLALDYVYPALPPKAQLKSGRLRSIYNYNDSKRQSRIVQLLDDAVKLAEKQPA